MSTSDTCVSCGQPSGVIRRGLCRPCIRKGATPLPSAQGNNQHRSNSKKRAIGLSVHEKGGERTITGNTDQRVETLEDLIRVCQIDTTKWEIVEWKAGTYEVTSIPRAIGRSKNWRRDSTEPVTTLMYSVSAKMRPVKVLVSASLKDELVADLKAAVSGPKLWLPTTPKTRGDYLFEYSPFDLHMGKFAWAKETVTDYDVEIATDLFRQSVDYLLNNAVNLAGGSLDRILFIVGNDVAHIDNKRGQTTHGTQMDVDTRYARIFRRICQIHREAVARLLDVAPVDIVVVPGNHDEQTSFLVGEVLGATFHNSPSVTIDNNPHLRKYYKYGVNLLGFTHGDSEKVSELGLTMAREASELWHEGQSREWHIGHLHIAENWEHRAKLVQGLHSDKGVRIRRLTSMSAHDFWHTKHGYMDRRACDSFVFHRDAGFTAHLSFNIDHFSGKGLA